MADCPTCHEPIPPKSGPGRPATYHPGCKPKRRTPVLGLAQPPGGGDVVPMRPAAGAAADPLSLEVSTRARLRRVDRHETTEGIAALVLARLIDAGGYNAQGAAALVKAHREALDVALEGTAPEADVIDLIFETS